MKNIFLIAGALIIGYTTSINAQTEKPDLKAKGILDELSAKTKSYTSIKADFTIEMVNKEKKTEKQDGAIQLKGDKYKLDIKGQQIICDGKTTWTYLADANEVQVNNIDPNANDGISPSNIFTIYEKGFKYKFDKEETVGAVVIQTIILYPISPDKKKYHTVKLMIDKSKKQISSVKMMMKDGGTYTYTVKKFNPNTEIADASFVFDAKAHPGVEVVDLRE